MPASVFNLTLYALLIGGFDPVHACRPTLLNLSIKGTASKGIYRARVSSLLNSVRQLSTAVNRSSTGEIQCTLLMQGWVHTQIVKDVLLPIITWSVNATS